MGNYTRKATFVAKAEKSGRVFIPVNKRAKTVVKKAGKRTKVTIEDLRALKNTGSYTFWHYKGEKLVRVR